MKAIYKEPAANILLNWQKLKVFPLRSGTKEGCPFSPFLFNILLEVIATVIRQQKEIKGIRIGKEEVKLSLFAGNVVAFIKCPVDSTKKLLHVISAFGKTAGYKANIQILKAFLYTNKEMSDRK